jgi:glycosyltransferase involved in cell wall biosynthesis
MKIKKAVIILPCLDEENTVGEVIEKLRRISKKSKVKFIIIAVDDASIDITLKILERRADKIISLKKRKSLAEVIRIGLRTSLKYNPDVIVHIDADGQYDPAELPKLFDPIKKDDADFVIGNRDIWKLKHMPFLKKIGNSFFTKLVSIIIKEKLTDAQSGFRVIRGDAAKNIKLVSNYTYTQEEIIRGKKLGYRIKEIPIKFKERAYGRSRLIRSPFEYGIYVLFDIIKIILKN